MEDVRINLDSAMKAAGQIGPWNKYSLLRDPETYKILGALWKVAHERRNL